MAGQKATNITLPDKTHMGFASIFSSSEEFLLIVFAEPGRTWPESPQFVYDIFLDLGSAFHKKF